LGASSPEEATNDTASGGGSPGSSSECDGLKEIDRDLAREVREATGSSTMRSDWTEREQRELAASNGGKGLGPAWRSSYMALGIKLKGGRASGGRGDAHSGDSRRRGAPDWSVHVRGRRRGGELRGGLGGAS